MSLFLFFLSCVWNVSYSSIQMSRIYVWSAYRQLRARRVLSIFKEVPLRTRMVLSLYKVCGDGAFLVLSGTSLNSDESVFEHGYSCFLVHGASLWSSPIKTHNQSSSFVLLSPFSPRPHWNAFWYNDSGLGFLKILNYVPKEREKLCANNEPSLVAVKCCDDP